jgi:hypothetical protein
MWERRPRRESRLETAPTVNIFAMIGGVLENVVFQFYPAVQLRLSGKSLTR